MQVNQKIDAQINDIKRQIANHTEIKAQLKNKFPYKGLENEEVPILKCYRVHIERNLIENNGMFGITVSQWCLVAGGCDDNAAPPPNFCPLGLRMKSYDTLGRK